MCVFVNCKLMGCIVCLEGWIGPFGSGIQSRAPKSKCSEMSMAMRSRMYSCRFKGVIRGFNRLGLWTIQSLPVVAGTEMYSSGM